MSMTNNSTGNYAAVNGINLYYEIHGTGQPLIMLHGGFGSFADTYPTLSTKLALHQQVIGVDLYGHGHTALTERPIDFGQMADDIAGLVQHLGLEKVDILGYSLGASVALQTAIRHPEQVNKLVVISIPFKHSGWHPEVQAGFSNIASEFLLETPVYTAYKAVAPKPEDFTQLVTRMREALVQNYDWTTAVSHLQPPTLIVAGDSDSLPVAHAAEFFNLLGGSLKDADWTGENLLPSQLAILPGSTHYNIIYRTDLLLPVLVSFLDRKAATHQ